MFSITESALDPEYCKHLWETYSVADSSHENWWKRHKPTFNTHRDRQEDLEEEWIEIFQIPACVKETRALDVETLKLPAMTSSFPEGVVPRASAKNPSKLVTETCLLLASRS